MGQLMIEQIALLKDVVDFAKIATPAIMTLLAAWLAYRFANRQAKHTKALEFNAKQVAELYSPMIGCIRNIRAHSELRVELSGAADGAWRKICELAPHPFFDHEKHFEPFNRLIEYDNVKWREELFPLYQKMLSIFTDNYWLAEESTQQYYPELCRFIEVWNRWINEALPREVLMEINHTEDRLKDFYADLERHMKRLRESIAMSKST